MTTVHGAVASGFGPVREAFASLFDDLGETGASVAAVAQGRPVVELWAGRADAATPWRRDTAVHTYSVTKPFTAAVLLALVGQGRVDLDDLVTAWWPGYGAHGKQDTTVRHVLSHQAGLPAFAEPAPDLTDWPATVAHLAARAPWFEPGTAIGEHALTYGHLVGEIVRRVTGELPALALRRLVSGPLELDFWIGAGGATSVAAVVDPTGTWGADLLAGGNDAYRAALGVPAGPLDPAVVNSPAWRAAQVPAVNGHGTALAVARFYAALVDGGAGVLDAGVVREALTPQAIGTDVVLGREVAWGLGPQIDGAEVGLGGIGGHVGYGNRDARFGFGFVTRTLGGFDRADRVAAAFEACLGG